MGVLTSEELRRRIQREDDPEGTVRWACWSPYAGWCGEYHRSPETARTRHGAWVGYVVVGLRPGERLPRL